MWRKGASLLSAASVAGLCLAVFPDAVSARAAAIAALCLALWLTEAVPAFVPTLILLVATPLALGDIAAGFTLRDVLGWTADPVLLLFFGGFVLGEAASEHGIDRALAAAAVRAARGRARALVALFGLTTAFLSMWMSNIAAAALMIAALRPMLGLDERVRRALLVAVALGANLGGMATPIGSGPNAIAVAATPPDHPVSFAAWMAFAVPLTLAALAVATLLVIVRHDVRGGVPAAAPDDEPRPAERPRTVALLGAVAVLVWLTEPLHGVPAALVSLALAVVLFGTGLVPAPRLRGVDWGTLLLIGGGVALGRLVEHAGLLHRLAPMLDHRDGLDVAFVGGLLLASAALSSVMSNTATATLLIPLATTASPDGPALPLLVALAASFGMPFVISTPPNAMVVGAGVRAVDLLVPGLLLLVGGVLALTLTGPGVLGWFGYPIG